MCQCFQRYGLLTALQVSSYIVFYIIWNNITEFVLFISYIYSQTQCVQVTESSWFVWKFEIKEPYFGKDANFMAKKFLVFANVYKVKVKLQANQHFLKCDCLHYYERCGIPCTHIMKITNEIDETMITVQHRKVYSASQNRKRLVLNLNDTQ
jgi:hypothetical protein